MDDEFDKTEQALRNKASTGDTMASAQLAVFLAVRRFDKTSSRYSRAMIGLASAAILLSLVQIAVAICNALRR